MSEPTNDELAESGIAAAASNLADASAMALANGITIMDHGIQRLAIDMRIMRDIEDTLNRYRGFRNQVLADVAAKSSINPSAASGG